MFRKKEKQKLQPEFPGAPVWDDWLSEQQEVKKREVGFMRRVGRAAIEAAAVVIVEAKDLPRAITEVRYEKNIQAQKRLKQTVARAESPKAIPRTDLRKVDSSRALRFGVRANSSINKANKRALKDTSERVDRLSNKVDKNRWSRRGLVETWASRKLAKIDRKRQETHERRQEQFQDEKDQAWDKYLENNPQEKKRLMAEQQQRDKQYEIDSRNTHYSQMLRHAAYDTKYFAERSAYSFSKALPRRPRFSGSYDELAKSSIEKAAEHRQKDGSIDLLGPNMLAKVVSEKLPLTADSDRPSFYPSPQPTGSHVTERFSAANDDLRQEIEGRHDYVGGVATSLWKMGFVNFEREEGIAYGKGEFNPDVEWNRDAEGVVYASLPYNPENELHRIVAGERADESDFRIQLAIDNRDHNSSQMSVNLAEQPAAMAQAA